MARSSGFLSRAARAVPGLGPSRIERAQSPTTGGDANWRTRAIAERRRRDRRGVLSEWIAAACLAAKGYRILDRRHTTPAGEIDIVAVRGRRLAFVEVKARLTRPDAEAAITARQRARIRRAAQLWLAQRPAYHRHEISFDLVLLVRGGWPRHIVGGL